MATNIHTILKQSSPGKPNRVCFFTIFLALLLFISGNITALAQISGSDAVGKSMSSNSWYEMGERALEKGEVDSALAHWWEAYEKEARPDFRIGHSYLQTVVNNELQEHYQKASEIYYWGLKGEIEEHEKEALEKELKYLEPLLERKRFKQMERGVESSSNESLQAILSFWESVDPTPLTAYNERLIEHWQRIRYAREHYTKLNSGELDDRGPVYIKYGKPFYNKSGHLHYTSSTVSRLLNEGIQVPSFASQEQFAIVTTQQMNLENRIRQYYQNSDYEIWIYRDLGEQKENTIFMFGTRDGISSFRKIDSIEDFIPNAAYRTYLQNNYSFSSGGGASQSAREDVQFSGGAASGIKSQIDLTPALVLQLMYYQQFAALDSYFGRSFDEMMDRYISVSNMNGSTFKGLAREFGSIYGNKMMIRQKQAPAEKTNLYDEIMQLPVEYYQYRFLDSAGTPYTRVYSQISFDEAAYYDVLTRTNSLKTRLGNRYRLVSGILTEESESADEKVARDKTIRLTSLEPVVQVFEVTQKETQRKKISFSHELHKTGAEDRRIASRQTPFPPSLKGLNNSEIELNEPLKTEGLVLSDLIVGYRPADDSLLSSERDSLDFIISHQKSIPEGRDLAFYYEVYNVEPAGTDNISEYSFEYSIHRKKSGLFGGREKSLLSIDIQNTMIGSTDKNVITIDTSGQQEGDYELHIVIRDLHTGDSYTTVEEFSIEES